MNYVYCSVFLHQALFTCNTLLEDIIYIYILYIYIYIYTYIYVYIYIYINNYITSISQHIYDIDKRSLALSLSYI